MKQKKNMKTLTQSEEQIMQILWGLDRGFVKDIRERMPEPKPAYNTVSTIVRILEKKGFVSHQAYGNAHQYFPLITRADYSKNRISSLLKNYFKNSYSELVSFFASEQNMSVREMEEIMQIMDREIRNKQEEDQSGAAGRGEAPDGGPSGTKQEKGQQDDADTGSESGKKTKNNDHD